MKYKMIACDIDGTLLDDKRQISTKVKNKIKEASDMGIYFVLSSGRPYMTLRQYVELIGQDSLNANVIALNGASACINGNVIYNKFLSKKAKIEILKYINKHNLSYISWTDDALMYNRLDKYTQEYVDICIESTKKYQILKHQRIVDEKEFISKNVYKIIIIDESKRIEEIRLDFNQHFTDICAFSTSQAYFLEIYKKGISKEYAIKKIQKALNIKRNEIIAIGDGLNDLEMIKYAHLGVAMENASDKVKKEADYICSDNNHDGVAEVIDKFIIGE